MLPGSNDDMVLETAVNGNADAIVTFNQRDLKRTSKDFDCAVIFAGAALLQMRSLNPWRKAISHCGYSLR